MTEERSQLHSGRNHHQVSCAGRILRIPNTPDTIPHQPNRSTLLFLHLAQLYSSALGRSEKVQCGDLCVVSTWTHHAPRVGFWGWGLIWDSRWMPARQNSGERHRYDKRESLGFLHSHRRTRLFEMVVVWISLWRGYLSAVWQCLSSVRCSFSSRLVRAFGLEYSPFVYTWDHLWFQSHGHVERAGLLTRLCEVRLFLRDCTSL